MYAITKAYNVKEMHEVHIYTYTIILIHGVNISFKTMLLNLCSCYNYVIFYYCSLWCIFICYKPNLHYTCIFKCVFYDFGKNLLKQIVKLIKLIIF